MLDAPRAVKTAACALALAGRLLVAAAAAQPAPPVEPGGKGALFSVPSPVGPITYAPGRGLRFGRTGFAIGGYGDLQLDRAEGDPARLALDDLSFFFIWDPVPRLHLFTETELEQALSIDTNGRGGTRDAEFTVERVYGDYLVSDHLGLRLGKFLTPVGRWNLIHAQPLVWTTSRPLATVLPFDLQTTGAMLFGTFYPAGGSLTYMLHGQFVDQFQREPEGLPADRSAGARLQYDAGEGWSAGASYYAFEEQHDAWHHLGGLDLLARYGPVEVMGEFVFEDAPGSSAHQWGLYVQPVIEVARGLYLVGRYEHFAQRQPDPEVNLFVLGTAYRPAPWIVLKLEYLIADHRAERSPPGLRSSVAVLF